MGLFDFFSKLFRNAPDPIETEADLPQARCCHYTLAHLALRSVAFEDPLGFLGVLASPDANRFLSDLMRSVAEHCRDREPSAGFGVEDIGIHRIRIGNRPCVVIEMPRPRATPEAHFVAAVLLADLEREEAASKKAALRYFTLEKGFGLDDQSRTVLCEWTADGSHLNFGGGPDPTLEAFAAAVEGLLAK